MKRFLLFCFLLIGLPAFAQQQSVQGNLTLADAATSCGATGTPTAGSALVLNLNANVTSAVVQLSGTWSATVNFMANGDDTNWVAVNALPLSGAQTAVTTATANGAWRITASSLQQIRVCVSPYTSGTVSASITSSQGPSANGLGSGSGGGSGTVTSVTIAGTANQVTASGTCTITISGTCTLSQPNAVILGTDNSAAGTEQLANGSANAHTILASGATTSNTIKGFATAPTTGDVVTCTTASTTCTLTDSGVTTPSAAGTGVLTQTIASGTAALGTGAISSGTCATVVTVAGTGIATTDDLMADFNADPTSTTGYSPSANGMLTIIKYPTSGNVNFKVCNNTASSITPGAVTLNWRVVR